MKVECAFGILKSRWRILDFIPEAEVSNISKIIMACVVLHNFCIKAGDDWEIEEDEDDNASQQNVNNVVLRDGENIKREILKNYL